MANWEIRQTTEADHATVDRLLSNADHKHLHLDWLDPAELTGKQPFLLASQDGQAVACLAAPVDAPGVAWLRAFAVAGGHSVRSVWEQLWQMTTARLRALQVRQVAAMALDEWVARLLRQAGFAQTNSVVFLELKLDPDHPQFREIPEPASDDPSNSAAQPNNHDLPRSRPITSSDLDRVLKLDAAAFDPLWRLSAESLQAAVSQASSSTLIVKDGVAAGYQITTSSPFSVHLARLAVRPEWHRMGLGRALVRDSIRAAAAMPIGRLSVNTQADNTASQALYRQLGFNLTGQHFPVFTAELQ